jgi:hypothetical protein
MLILPFPFDFNPDFFPSYTKLTIKKQAECKFTKLSKYYVNIFKSCDDFTSFCENFEILQTVAFAKIEKAIFHLQVL